MKLNLTILLSFFTVYSLFAEQIELSGKVTNTFNEPLAGVNIVIKGTTTGTTSDFDGNYTLRIPRQETTTVVFRFIGHQEQEVVILSSSNNVTRNIILQDSDIDLNPVIVSASRRQEKILDAPASITVLGQREIENNIALSPIDNLKTVPGIDIVNTGLVSSDVASRGFNNIFSGSILTIVDNRIARVPSLRVNAYQMIPNVDDDIERIEVLRGPASALYGPNSASGVMHIITRSPLDMEDDFETSISVGGGIERSVGTATIRHAAKINDRLGIKISGSYMQGQDWRFENPENELPSGDSIYLGRQSPEGRELTGEALPARLENFIRNYGGEIRLDYRFSDRSELILSGGLNSATNLELTGIGAAQAIDWRYGYGQARFRYGRLFTQFFVNTSNSGDTYLTRTGDLIVDRSKLYVAQIQHSSDFVDERLRLIYGVDALFTRPDTDGTINGRNEDSDGIDEFGAYVQGDFKINQQFSLVGATRLDYHNFVDDLFFSPRAGIIYKPTARHTFRATYNRAFGSPSSNNLSLDILQTQDVFGLGGMLGSENFFPGTNVRAIGNREGFTFSRTNGVPQYRSPFAPLVGATGDQFFDLQDENMKNAHWNVVTGIVRANFIAQGFPESIVDDILNNIIPNVLQDVEKKMMLATQQSDVPFRDVSPDDVKDLKSINNSITQTYEIGYKGILFDRLMFSADLYWSDISDFVSPLVVVTPNVFFDPQTMAAYLGPEIQAALEDPDNENLKNLLESFVDPNPGPFLTAVLTDASAQIPFGTVGFNEFADNDLYVTYTNIGSVNLWGADVGLTFLVNDDFRIFGSYSYASKDTFTVEGAQGGYISLNAPQHKASFGFDYQFSNIGLNVGGLWRWQDRFLANSAAYVGEVPAFNVIDVQAGYRMPFSENTRLSIYIQNVLNHEYQSFAGTPKLGRLTLLRLSHKF
ncbi:MAG: TonB-dependent receptor [Chitinophagaceae bacterium]|nr:MAG: TonB-dependent receptor [Chitinophagaceae bacterium]